MERIRNKQELRNQWRKTRDGIPAETRGRMSEKITENLLKHPLLEAERVFLYLSFRSEPETEKLLTGLLQRGTRVAVPLCEPKTHNMKAVEITRLEDLEVGHYGTMEPRSDLIEKGSLQIWSKAEVQVILVPGLVFDRHGFRLGYGGGYYDRYLEGFSGCSIGLAFSNCVIPDLGFTAPDRAVDMIMTEHGMILTEDER